MKRDLCGLLDALLIVVSEFHGGCNGGKIVYLHPEFIWTTHGFRSLEELANFDLFLVSHMGRHFGVCRDVHYLDLMTQLVGKADGYSHLWMKKIGSAECKCEFFYWFDCCRVHTLTLHWL